MWFEYAPDSAPTEGQMAIVMLENEAERTVAMFGLTMLHSYKIRNEHRLRTLIDRKLVPLIPGDPGIWAELCIEKLIDRQYKKDPTLPAISNIVGRLQDGFGDYFDFNATIVACGIRTYRNSCGEERSPLDSLELQTAVLMSDQLESPRAELPRPAFGE